MFVAQKENLKAQELVNLANVRKSNYNCKSPNDRGKLVVIKVEDRQKVVTTQPVALQNSIYSD